MLKPETPKHCDWCGKPLHRTCYYFSFYAPGRYCTSAHLKAAEKAQEVEKLVEYRDASK